MSRFVGIFLIVFAMATPALAGPGASLVQPGTLHGDYYFYAVGQRPGEPVCAERWRFGDDDKLTIFSGQEIVTERFRVEEREFHNDDLKATMSRSWLVTSDPVSNGQTDCLGHAHNVYKPESAMMLYRAADGGIVTCEPMGNGAMRPFGHFYPAADIDAKTGGNVPVK